MAKINCLALAVILLLATIAQGHIYGRGVGYASEKECELGECSADEPHHLCPAKSDLPAEDAQPGQFESRGVCERVLSIWYPKCKPGYKNLACCLCSDEVAADQEDGNIT